MAPHSWLMHVACCCHNDKLLQEIAIIFFFPSIKDTERIDTTSCWLAGTLREDTVLIFEHVHITLVLKG